MVPRSRLLLWTAVIVLPFATLAGTVPGALLPSLAILGLFVALAVADALWGAGSVRTLRVELPSLVRLQKDRAGEFALVVHNSARNARLLRLALAFPDTIPTPQEEQLVQIPAGMEESRLTWACRPSKRGSYTLRRAYLETQSPLRFWAFRRQQEIACELRVYPNLEDERRQVAALFLRRGRVGVHTQRSAGTGREFEKLRDYAPGDNLSDIHWKASARRQSLISKVYQVERTHEVYVVVDTSRLSARSVGLAENPEQTGGTAMERYVSAALILALAAEQQGDQFGLITFSDRVHSFVRARTGPAHLDACRDRLYALQPQDVSPDFEELFTLIRLRLRKRALIIVLTSLDDPVLAESFVKATDLSARQHLVLVDMLRPPGLAPLFSEPAADLDAVYGALAGHWQWQKLRELQKVLQRRGVRLALVQPERLAAEILAQHADVRARQLV